MGNEGWERVGKGMETAGASSRASGPLRNFMISGFFVEKNPDTAIAELGQLPELCQDFFRMASSAELCQDFFRRIGPEAVSGFFAQGSVRIFRSTVLAVKCTCRVISWDFV